MRSIKAVALACATFCACAAILLQASAGATAAMMRTPLTYDPATQSHPGACSQDTLNVAQAVNDLSENGVLGQYASIVGVHATRSALTNDMKQALTVLKVLKTTVTANHGCTTYGIIFPTGSRTLTAGETVGVALPASVRAKLCGASTAGCERKVFTEHDVFPTNCWNLNQGNVRVAVYLHKPRPKPKPKPTPKPKPKPKPKKPVTKAKVKLAQPSATTASTCGVGGPGYETLTLSNGAGAAAAATFDVNGKTYGPVAAGSNLTVTVGLQQSGNTALKVSSGGDVVLNQSIPPDQCPATPAPTVTPPATTPPTAAAPTATAAFSCSAGGVVVTLSNGSAATAVASFDVNGTTYGPLNPGASDTVTVPVSPGATGKLTVTSGTTTLINGASYTSACAAQAGVTLVGLYCTSTFNGELQFPPGGGTLAVQLTNGAQATLPASFNVTVAGSTTAGYGPTTIGPLAAGASQTLLIPVDASGNAITLSVTSGGAPVTGGDQTITGGCPGPPEVG